MSEDGGTADDTPRGDPEWHRDRFPAWDSDESALRAARTEARESLAETIDAIRRIDESAMKTLRIDLILVGLSLTAASSFRFATGFVNELTILGLVAVILSALVAVTATLGSDYPTGVSDEYVAEFQRAAWSEREWNEWMLREYRDWLSEANEMVSGEARVLFHAKLLLGVGLLLLMLGIVAGIVGFIDPIVGLEVATRK